jgi:Protein of unknown function (DUF3631)
MSSIGDPERATEVRGVVNSSHCRADAQVIRNVPVPDGYEPRAFSTWAPMALAYIKRVDDQIRDRSVIIPMQRKAPDQAVTQMRLDQDQGFGVLASKAARWASDHFDALRRADPSVPRELNDRAADNWRCLLAIADLAGAPWQDGARAAAVALSTDADDEDTIGVELLRDLQGVFDSLNADRLLSSTIVAHLVGMEGRPWAEFGRAGKPITPNQLARLLKPFKIHPASVRPDIEGDGTKGYKRDSFLELWDRYFQTGTTAQPTATATFSEFQTGTPESDVPVRNRPKATATATCAVVPDENPESGRKEGNGDASASFAPGADWSDVPPGAVLPPGCEIQMDMTTGRQQARKAGGAYERELVATTCPVCRFTVYRDNATQTGGGVWVHPACARSRPSSSSYPETGYDFTAEEFRAFCAAAGTTLEGVARSLGIRRHDLVRMRKAARIDFADDPFGRQAVDQLRARLRP